MTSERSHRQTSVRQTNPHRNHVDFIFVEDACALMGVSIRTGYRLISKHGLHLRRMVVASLPPNHAPLDTSLAPEETPDAPL